MVTKKLNHIKCVTWVPHCADASIFKPKPEIEKKYDVALAPFNLKLIFEVEFLNHLKKHSTPDLNRDYNVYG